MTRKQYLMANVVLILIALVLLIELIRDASFTGDFIGYVNAGNSVLLGNDIYADILNTWPPFFSIFSVPLAWIDGVSPYFVRFLWLAASIAAMWFVVSESVILIFKKPISLGFGTQNSLVIQDTLIVVPMIILLRYMMDNMANIQINIFMLFGALMSIVFFIKKRYVWVGILLGLTISLKVYTIFFLLYFLFKREFKPVLWTLFFLVVFNAITFVVFGYDQALEYYQHWVNEVTDRSYIANHKNQSIFGAFLRLFTTDDPKHGLYTNIMDVSPHIIKRVTFITVAIAAVFPAYLFRNKLKDRTSLHSILQYSLLFTAIPLLSPVAWKAYFIFLWIPYLLLYALIYRVDSSAPARTLTILKYLFWISVVLTVGSAELIVGNYFSDVLEAYSAITIGTIILLVMQLLIVMNAEKYDLGTIKYKVYKPS